eukprot:992507_1
MIPIISVADVCKPIANLNTNNHHKHSAAIEKYLRKRYLFIGNDVAYISCIADGSDVLRASKMAVDSIWNNTEPHCLERVKVDAMLARKKKIVTSVTKGGIKKINVVRYNKN